MKKLAILLILLSTTSAFAETADFFVTRSQTFLSNLLKARSFEAVYPELSANTVKVLKAKTPDSRHRAFRMMKLGAAMGSSTPMKLKESKIGAKQAAITLVGDKSTQKTKNGTMTTSSSMEFEFLKENGQWKIDLSEKVSRM